MLNGVEDMAYKNKKTKHRGKATLFITTIAMLNLFGVSYAFGEDEITMFVEISTANFEVAFDKNQILITLILGMMRKIAN